MKLFEQEFASDYFSKKINSLKQDIENLSDTQILNTKIDQLKDYYLSTYCEQIIQLYMDKKDINIEKSKLNQHNFWYDVGITTSPSIQVDSCKVNYSIPFSGDYHLLHLRPKMSILSSFEIDGFENTNSTKYMTCIKFSMNISMYDLDNSTEPQKYIDSTFNKEFTPYIEMINNLNNDISTYNSELEKYITSYLSDRKNKASKFTDLIQKLTIPLKINDQIPSMNHIPLVLKKEIKSFPSQSTPEESWCLSDEDYSYIKKVISQECTSFEHSPVACQKLSEEELRDMILGTLNTHFDSIATGETFSKAGKTDIRIQFKNKSAYIAECKIWHGISEFKKAIEQLFSYTTWRDIKTSLIVFNKENKDFTSIINKIRSELNTHELIINLSTINKNEWQCVAKKSIDSQESILLHVIVCDISK